MAAGAGNCASTSTLRVAATLILIITLTLPPPLSVNSGSLPSPASSTSRSRSEERAEEIVRKKWVQVGSRPPGCMNKCMNCRPCEATLVIPPHHQAFSHKEDDTTYHLLFWKCRCGDKLFHP